MGRKQQQQQQQDDDGGGGGPGLFGSRGTTPSPAAYFLLRGNGGGQGGGEEEAGLDMMTPQDGGGDDDEVHMRSISGFGTCMRVCLCAYVRPAHLPLPRRTDTIQITHTHTIRTKPNHTALFSRAERGHPGVHKALTRRRDVFVSGLGSFSTAFNIVNVRCGLWV